MRLRAVAAVAAFLAFAPAPAGAAETHACADVTEPWPAVEGKYYVPQAGGVDVWRESNALPGLQPAACRRADGTTASADAHQGPLDLPPRVCVYPFGTKYCTS